MNRIALFLGAIVLSIQIAGCGSSEQSVPEDRSNMPPEVKEAEDKLAAESTRREAENAKKAAKKAPH